MNTLFHNLGQPVDPGSLRAKVINNPALQWEFEWIDSNPQYYYSFDHMRAVKECIFNRYLANELRRIENVFK